jgi:hypothetical protein
MCSQLFQMIPNHGTKILNNRFFRKIDFQLSSIIIFKNRFPYRFLKKIAFPKKLIFKEYRFFREIDFYKRLWANSRLWYYGQKLMLIVKS